MQYDNSYIISLLYSIKLQCCISRKIQFFKSITTLFRCQEYSVLLRMIQKKKTNSYHLKYYLKTILKEFVSVRRRIKSAQSQTLVKYLRLPRIKQEDKVVYPILLRSVFSLSLVNRRIKLFFCDTVPVFRETKFLHICIIYRRINLLLIGLLLFPILEIIFQIEMLHFT